jgi:hypothetical protein
VSTVVAMAVRLSCELGTPYNSRWAYPDLDADLPNRLTKIADSAGEENIRPLYAPTECE